MGNSEGGNDNILYVQMFGNFCVTWNNRLIIGGSKSSETQFAYLMQLLLHDRENGVARDYLERLLFEDRDIRDLHHATRSVIYNAKKKLRAAGLPDVNYIEQDKGVFRWTDQIRVEEDAAKLDRLYMEAEAAKRPERKQELYLEAIHCYTGEFLETQMGIVWVAQESRRYREIFCDCMEKAVELLRETQDFLQMEKIGLYAAKLLPLADWETVTMEALVSMGREEDAGRLYDDTVELYFQEQGLRPSERLMELFGKLGTQIGHQYALLDSIQEKLAEDEEETSGGYLCSYPVFRGIYHMVERIMERGGQSVYLMLCTVVDSKGNPMRDGPMLEELSGRLEEAICYSVRRSDAVNRYGKGQYLVLLMNITQENCKILQRRINERFLVGRQRTGIQYHVNSVICTSVGERIL